MKHLIFIFIGVALSTIIITKFVATQPLKQNATLFIIVGLAFAFWAGYSLRKAAEQLEEKR